MQSLEDQKAAGMIPGFAHLGAGEEPWMTRVLVAAGVYDILWSIHVLLWPNWLFHWAGVPPPNYPGFWQFLALLIGVGGLGYLAAASHPFRHWPIVFVGFLGKILGIAAFLKAVTDQRINWRFGATVLTNDVLWVLPFTVILWQTYRSHVSVKRTASADVQGLAFRARTNYGQTLLELSRKQPLLLVFLRYRGCPFCREALSDLSRLRSSIEARGCQIVFVHMEQDAAVHDFLLKYGLHDLSRISDPRRTLYRAFGLRNGSLWQLVGPLTWLRGISAMLVEGHFPGWFTSNPFQMPGVFAVHRGNILRSFVHQLASDRPGYLKYVPVPIEGA